MTALYEMQLDRAGEMQAKQGFRSRPRMSDQEKRQIFEDAKKEGKVDNLTPKQMEIFRLRGFFEGGEGPLLPFPQVVLQDKAFKSRQAAHSREKSGFMVLENGRQRKSRMKPAEREFILNNPDLPATQIASVLGHDQHTVTGWKDQVGISRRPVGRPKQDKSEVDPGKDNAETSRNPRGRPKREMPSDLIADLYSNQGLGSPEIAGMFECSVSTIIDRLRARGAEIKPRGRYLKHK